MGKCYCSPVAESISIVTFVVAASTTATRTVGKPIDKEPDTGGGSWGSIWD